MSDKIAETAAALSRLSIPEQRRTAGLRTEKSQTQPVRLVVEPQRPQTHKEVRRVMVPTSGTGDVRIEEVVVEVPNK